MKGRAPADILVVCLGNEIIADDAVGYEVYRRLADAAPAGARLAYGGVEGIRVLDLLDGSIRVLLIVDAVQTGAPVGTVLALPWEEVPAAGRGAVSAHNIGIREAIQMGTALYPERMPEKIHLIGIEGRCFDQPRPAMTPAVAEAIDSAVGIVIKLIGDV